MSIKTNTLFRIISIILVITFLAQDICWAYPDSFRYNTQSQDNKLAPPSFFEDKDFPARAIGLALEHYIEHNGIPRSKLTLEAVKAVLKKHEKEEWFVSNNIVYEPYASEILIRFPGYILRYYDPANISDRYSNEKDLNTQGEHTERLGNISKQLLRVKSIAYGPTRMAKNGNTQMQVTSAGTIRVSGYDTDPNFNLGIEYAGKMIELKPYKPGDWKSGFNVFYNSLHIATYYTSVDLFLIVPAEQDINQVLRKCILSGDEPLLFYPETGDWGSISIDAASRNENSHPMKVMSAFQPSEIIWVRDNSAFPLGLDPHVFTKNNIERLRRLGLTDDAIAALGGFEELLYSGAVGLLTLLFHTQPLIGLVVGSLISLEFFIGQHWKKITKLKDGELTLGQKPKWKDRIVIISLGIVLRLIYLAPLLYLMHLDPLLFTHSVSVLFTVALPSALLSHGIYNIWFAPWRKLALGLSFDLHRLGVMRRIREKRANQEAVSPELSRSLKDQSPEGSFYPPFNVDNISNMVKAKGLLDDKREVVDLIELLKIGNIVGELRSDAIGRLSRYVGERLTDAICAFIDEESADRDRGIRLDSQSIRYRKLKILEAYQGDGIHDQQDNSLHWAVPLLNLAYLERKTFVYEATRQLAVRLLKNKHIIDPVDQYRPQMCVNALGEDVGFASPPDGVLNALAECYRVIFDGGKGGLEKEPDANKAKAILGLYPKEIFYTSCHALRLARQLIVIAEDIEREEKAAGKPDYLFAEDIRDGFLACLAHDIGKGAVDTESVIEEESLAGDGAEIILHDFIANIKRDGRDFILRLPTPAGDRIVLKGYAALADEGKGSVVEMEFLINNISTTIKFRKEGSKYFFITPVRMAHLVNAPRRLTNQEKKIVKVHPNESIRILEKAGIEFSDLFKYVVLYHHDPDRVSEIQDETLRERVAKILAIVNPMDIIDTSCDFSRAYRMDMVDENIEETISDILRSRLESMPLSPETVRKVFVPNSDAMKQCVSISEETNLLRDLYFSTSILPSIKMILLKDFILELRNGCKSARASGARRTREEDWLPELDVISGFVAYLMTPREEAVLSAEWLLDKRNLRIAEFGRNFALEDDGNVGVAIISMVLNSVLHQSNKVITYNTLANFFTTLSESHPEAAMLILDRIDEPHAGKIRKAIVRIEAVLPGNSEEGIEAVKAALREINFRTDDYYIIRGDMDKLNALNKIYSKSIIGTFEEPADPDNIYTVPGHSLFREALGVIASECNALGMRAYRHAGGDELIIPRTSVSREAVEGMMDSVRKAVREHFLQRYGVAKVDELTRGERDALIGNENVLAISRYRHGFNVLIRKNPVMQFSQQLHMINENITHTLNPYDFNEGLMMPFTVSFGGFSVRSVIREMETNTPGVEMLGEDGRIKDEYIDNVCLWGFRVADDMLKIAKKTRDTVFVSDDIKRADVKKPLVAESSAAKEPKKLESGIDTLTGFYTPSRYRQEAGKKNNFLLIEVSTYNGKTSREEGGFHAVNTALLHDNANNVLRILSEEIRGVFSDPKFEDAVMCRASPDRFYVATHQDLNSSVLVDMLKQLKERVQPRLDTFSEGLTEPDAKGFKFDIRLKISKVCVDDVEKAKTRLFNNPYRAIDIISKFEKMTEMVSRTEALGAVLAEDVPDAGEVKIFNPDPANLKLLEEGYRRVQEAESVAAMKDYAAHLTPSTDQNKNADRVEDSKKSDLSGPWWVIVVDDEDVIREPTQLLLEGSKAIQESVPSNTTIIACAGGEECLTIMEQIKHDAPEANILVLTDVTMPPGITGLELMKRIENQYPQENHNVVIGIMGGEISERDCPGADFVVKKPFKVDKDIIPIIVPYLKGETQGKGDINRISSEKGRELGGPVGSPQRARGDLERQMRSTRDTVARQLRESQLGPYPNFDAAFKAFKRDEISWARTVNGEDVSIRRAFVDMLAELCRTTPGELLTSDFQKRRPEFEGQSLKGLLAVYKNNVKRLKDSLGIEDLVPKEEAWQEKNRDWARVCDIINGFMNAGVEESSAEEWLKKRKQLPQKVIAVLAAEVQKGDGAAKDAIVMAHTGTVRDSAVVYCQKPKNPGISEKEFFNAGMATLGRRAEDYDPAEPKSFSMYLFKRLQGTMEDLIRTHNRKERLRREAALKAAEEGPTSQDDEPKKRRGRKTRVLDMDPDEAEDILIEAGVSCRNIEVFINIATGKMQYRSAGRKWKVGISRISQIVTRCWSILDTERKALTLEGAIEIFKMTVEALARKIAPSMVSAPQPVEGKGLILYADDIIERGALLELESLLLNKESRALNDSTIVVYGRNPRYVEILQDMIAKADKNIKVCPMDEATLRQIPGNNDIYIDEAKVLDQLITFASRSGVNNGRLLGVIRGCIRGEDEYDTEQVKTEVKRVLSNRGVSLVSFESDRGLYSFINALNILISAKADEGSKKDKRLIILPPMTDLSARLRHAYERYMAVLTALQAA